MTVVPPVPARPRATPAALAPATLAPETSPPEPAPPQAKQLFFPAVDGLRGIAIASVLLFHTGWSPRGLFGVDVFFVVSGFLITLLLLREVAATGRLRIGAFYARRAKRLLPGLLITLGATVIAVWLVGTREELRTAGVKAIAALGQVANWQQIRAGQDYWAGGEVIQPMSHLWSLSITEQFYLVWPVAVLVVWFVARRSAVAASVILFVLAVASAFVSPLLWDGSNSDRLYLGTEARAVGFVAGAALAAVVFTARTRPRHARQADLAPGHQPATEGTRRVTGTVAVTTLSALMLAGILAASVVTASYHEPWLYQGGIAAVAFAAAIFTATLCSDANLLTRFFSFSLFAWFGRMAYTVYLLHLPVYWGVQQFAPDSGPLQLLIFGGALTTLLSVFVHHVVTEPLRRRRWPAVKALPALAVSIGAVLGLAYLLPAQREAGAVSTRVVADDSRVVLERGRSGGRPVVMTVGDSLAQDLGAVLTDHGTGLYAVHDLGYGGCALFDPDGRVRATSGYEWANQDDCPEPVSWAAQGAAEHSPDIVLVHASWDAADQYFEGRWVRPGDAAWAQRYTQQLDAVVDGIRQGAPHAVIAFTNDRTLNGIITDPGPLQEYNAFIGDYAARRGHVVLDLGGQFVGAGGEALRTDKDGRALFRGDDVHLSRAGKEHLSGWLENTLAVHHNERVLDGGQS